MRPALARRCRTRRRRDRRRCARQRQVEVGDVDVRLVPVDHRDVIRRHADVARVGIAMDDARRATGKSRPRCSASNDTLRRHRAKVDPCPLLGAQKVDRRSPARALGPAGREPMQLAQGAGDATPVGFGLGRSARSRCRNRPVSHARSASLRWPRRPTARCPPTRTLHTSLTPTPPVSGSMRTTSSPHCSSASHPTGHIFAAGPV
jgi:hypothetical protein